MSYFQKYLLPAFIIAGSFISNLSVTAQQPITPAGTSSIKITFALAPSTYSIQKSVLKYNKDFAYSFTFDDGKEDAYTHAYPLFKGGSASGRSFSGLYYTDGCGNKIPFRGGLAMTSVNSIGEDPHISGAESLKWPQVIELYKAGWNVFNHSYSHATGTGTNYTYEVTENRKYIQSKTGIDPVHFVVPAGDLNYVDVAFANGVKATYNENSFPGADGFKVDGPLGMNQFKLYRRFLDDSRFNSTNIKEKIDFIASQSSGSNHLWFADFTHHVSPEPKGGSLIFGTFEYYMDYIASAYGAGGADRIWMAPLQDVYEYLAVRENIRVGDIKNQNTVEAVLDFSNVPHDLDKYALTLLIDADQDITQVEGMGVTVTSFKGTGTQKIVNLEWSGHPNTVTATDEPKLMQVTKCPIAGAEISPNPVQGSTIMLKFMSDKEDQVSVSLIDRSGKETVLGNRTIQVRENNLEVDIRELQLPQGSYFIKLFSERDQCEATKLVVKY